MDRRGVRAGAGVRLMDRLSPIARLSRMPGIYALALQGFSGLIQVAAYFSLTGKPYLAFNEAFIAGNIVAMVAVLNLENTLLAGKASKSIFHYFALCWAVGLASTGWGIARGDVVPGIVSFACWLVCVRLFLAWASRQPARPLQVMLAGLLGAGAILTLNPQIVMAVAFLSMPLMAGLGTLQTLPDDDGPLAIGAASFRAYLKYLPHTICGFAIGYLDRAMAISWVGGDVGERYLRTVQICSWAAFLCFPVVFQLRSRLLAKRAITTRGLMTDAGMLAASFVAAVAVVWALVTTFGPAGRLGGAALALVVLAVFCSQFYQVISPLNFVRERFSTVNRITLASAATMVTVILLLLGVWKAEWSLATVLLMGWAVQVAGTIISLRGLGRGDEAPPPSASG